MKHTTNVREEGAMKKLSRNTGIIIVVLIVAVVAAVVYYAAPPYLYNKYNEDRRAAAGVTVRSVAIPGHTIVCAEGGAGEPIILLHGFGGNKDNWLEFAKFLTPGYRVIIPDLPGFGESTKMKEGEFSILAEADYVRLFAKALGLEKFHIAGHSMGGNIAGNFAANYPGMVKTLALISAARVISPVKSRLDLMLEKGDNPYMIKNEKDFDRFMAFMYYKPPSIPSFIKSYIARQLIASYKQYEKSFDDGWARSIFPESRIRQIAAPTLIVWGDDDSNFDVSCARIFQRNIKNSKLVIIRECGHLPIMEKPAETAEAYLAFLKER